MEADMELWDRFKRNWQKQTPEEKKKIIRDLAVVAVSIIGAGVIVGPAGAWVATSALLLKQQVEKERKLRDKYIQAKRPLPSSLKKWKEKSGKEKFLSAVKWMGMGAACVAVAYIGAAGVAPELMGAGGLAGMIGGATITASAGVFGRDALMRDDVKFTNAVYKINNDKKLSFQQKREAIRKEKLRMSIGKIALGPLLVSDYIKSQDLVMPQNKEGKETLRVSFSDHIKPQNLTEASSHTKYKVAWRKQQNTPEEKVEITGHGRKLDISDILRNEGGKGSK